MSTESQRTAPAPLTDKEIQAVTVGEVIPHAATIDLQEYDAKWPGLFAREARRITAALGNAIVMLEHVGSTSVPELAAKPIVDILLIVADSSDEASFVPALEAAGYVLRIREPDWHQHRLFKGPDTNINLHVFSTGDSEIARMIGFRDWLRTNAAERELYERTKRELAARTWTHVQNYADAKTEVVERIMERAGLPGRDEPALDGGEGSG